MYLAMVIHVSSYGIREINSVTNCLYNYLANECEPSRPELITQVKDIFNSAYGKKITSSLWT